MKKDKTKRHRLLTRLLMHFVLGMGALTMVLPLLWMVSTSLKTKAQIFEFPPQWIPDPIIWQNFRKAWDVVPLTRFFLNSVIVAITATAGQVCTSALAAYAFARMTFPGRDKVFLGYIATLMIPWSVTMIPVFILVKLLGWTDSYKALIIPGMFSAYGTFMLRQFFLSIPRDLEDAARIDGCGHFGTFCHVVIPLSKPALATLSIFTFMGNWNNFLWPLIVTNSTSLMTLPVGLASFQGMYTTEWGLLMAASLLSLLPVVLLFVLCQRYFVEGIKLSGFGGV